MDLVYRGSSIRIYSCEEFYKPLFYRDLFYRALFSRDLFYKDPFYGGPYSIKIYPIGIGSLRDLISLYSISIL